MNWAKVGTYNLDKSGETQVTLIRVEYEAPATSEEIIDWLADNTNIRRSSLGVEGCPGQWFCSRVEVVHNDDIYRYALVEVTSQLDV